MPYTLVEHDADLGLEVSACGLTELFAEAACALTGCLTSGAPVRRRLRRRVEAA